MSSSPDAAGPTCPQGQAYGEFGCTPVYATGECPPGTAPFLGTTECRPIGRASDTCPEGFVADPTGWGCAAIAPEADCPPGQSPVLGTTDCRNVGWTDCPPAFTARRNGWGCDVAHPSRACTGATRAALGSTSCLQIDSCGQVFPPAGATLFVDPQGPTDATHFRTIQAALDAAGPGAVISVERGTYPEALTLNGPVSIIGRCAEQVLIDGTNTMTSGVEAGAHRGSTIAHLSLRGHLRGVSVSEGGSISLDSVRIENARAAGALASGAGAEMTIARSVIRGTRYGSSSSTGVRAENGAAITLEDVDVSENVGSGIASLAMGASITGTRVLVRDHPIDGRVGGAGVSVQGGTLSLTESLILDSAKYGVVTAAAGTTAMLDRVVVKGSDAFSGRAGNGLAVTGGSTIRGVAVQLALNVGANALVNGEGSLLRLERSTLSDAVRDGNNLGGGVLVQAGGALEFVESAAVYNPSVALGAASGTMRIERSRTGFSKDQFAPGVLAGQGARLEVEDSFLGGSPGFDLQVMDPGTIGLMTKCLVQRAALSVLDGGLLEIESSALLASRDLGVFVDAAGTELVVRNSVFSGGLSIDDPAGGQGIFAGAGGRAVVWDSDFDANMNGAVVGEAGSTIELHRTNVRRGVKDAEGKNGYGAETSGVLLVEETAFVDNAGVGINLRARMTSDATIVRSAFIRNGVAGVFGYAETRATVDDSSFVEQHPGELTDEFGFGLLSGGNVSIWGALFLRNTNASLALEASSSPNGADIEVLNSVIAQTLPDVSGYGHGLIAGNGARVRLDGVYVFESANVGLAFTDASALVQNCLIAKNTTGVHVQRGSMLSEVSEAPSELGRTDVVFVQTTRLLGNGTRIGAGEIPLPEIFGP